MDFSAGNQGGYVPPAFFPRDRDAAVVLRSITSPVISRNSGLPLLLVCGPEGSSCEGVAGNSLPDRLARFAHGGRGPGVERISIPLWLQYESAVVSKLLELLFDKHPWLRRGWMTKQRRESLFALGRTDPFEAGQSLMAFLYQEDRRHGVSPVISKVKMIVQLEGAEGLFEHEFLNLCETEKGRGFRDLLQFINGMSGQNSVMFSICCQSWASKLLFDIVEKAGNHFLLHELALPDEKETGKMVSQFVGKLASEPHLKGDSAGVRALIDRLTEDFFAYPECNRFLPELLGRIREEAEALDKPLCILDYTGIEGLPGFLSERSERVFREQDAGERKISVSILPKILRNRPPEIDFSDVVGTAAFMSGAFRLKSRGILAIKVDPESGSRIPGVFIPAHPDLFSKWSRVNKWEARHLVSVQISSEEPVHTKALVEGSDRPIAVRVSGKRGLLAGLSISVLAVLVAIWFMAVVNRPSENKAEQISAMLPTGSQQLSERTEREISGQRLQRSKGSLLESRL